MPILYDEAEHIFSTPKRLLAPLTWSSSSRNGNNQSSIDCRVQVDGTVIPRGVIFRIIAFPTHLRTFTFQLECERQDVRAHVTLYRLEVAPFRLHPNKMYGPNEINGRIFPAGETHEHDFHDSLTSEMKLRASSCEQARAVPDAPHDFATALARVCSRINIINGAIVPPPLAQGDLFES